MSKESNIIRFDNVSFKYNEQKVTLINSNFNVRNRSKVSIMGQNGAGKSTLFKLITGEIQPTSGEIFIDQYAEIGIAKQMVPVEKLDMTVLEYFESVYPEKEYGIEKDVYRVLGIVNLDVLLDKVVRELSGGQKARLLLASAIIKNPDILLLDEPTNNLDSEGIDHLTEFLINYPKTCLVISHDAEFLNSFTDGVLNLDVHTHQVEQFIGDYYDVLEQIGLKLDRDKRQNARLKKSIQDRYDKVNKLGGKSVAMRRLARKVREDIENDKENFVEMRKDDKTIVDFNIPNQHVPNPLMKINEIEIMKDYQPQKHKVDIEIHRGMKIIITGPNGIGKTTMLKSIMNGNGCEISKDVKVGYYSQDFSELDFNKTGIQTLLEVMDEHDMQEVFKTGSKFLLSSDLLRNKVGTYSEGQKGLLSYARFMLQEPALLIMDEPTNHINFRHLPVIAKALDEFEGGMILVSHVPEFVEEINIDKELDLKKIRDE